MQVALDSVNVTDEARKALEVSVNSGEHMKRADVKVHLANFLSDTLAKLHDAGEGIISADADQERADKLDAAKREEVETLAKLEEIKKRMKGLAPDDVAI